MLRGSECTSNEHSSASIRGVIEEEDVRNSGVTASFGRTRDCEIDDESRSNEASRPPRRKVTFCPPFPSSSDTGVTGIRSNDQPEPSKPSRPPRSPLRSSRPKMIPEVLIKQVRPKALT